VETGRIEFGSAASFGVTLDVTVREDAQAEFSYSRQETEVRLRPSTPDVDPVSFDVAVEYYQLGGLLEWPQGSRGQLRPFFSLTIGATRFDPEPAEVETEWRFSIATGGGTKIFLNERLGLRLQARLLLPITSANSTWFCYLPGGCLVTVDGTAMAQGDVSAGLILAF
jgi:hypothetical protein